jgi:hypothetical protein
MVKSLSESGPLPTPVASGASFFTVSIVMIAPRHPPKPSVASVCLAARTNGTPNIAITAKIVMLATTELIPVRRTK